VSEGPAPGPHRRRALRVLFVVYALALFIATHWPELTIEADGIDRPDLLVHVGAFGLFAFLALWAQLFGPVTGARNVWLTWLLASLWAGFDEGTQAIPIIRRQAVLDDFFANLLGVALGTLAAYTLARFAKGRAV